MYKALRVLKVGGNVFYIGDVLPENAPEIVNIEAFVAKGWVEMVENSSAKPAAVKPSASTADLANAMPQSSTAKKKKKTKKKISSILSSKAKEPAVESSLEAVAVPKPDLD